MCIELSEMHGAWIYHLAVLHGALLLHVVLPHHPNFNPLPLICARSLPCPPPSDREEEKRDCAIKKDCLKSARALPYFLCSLYLLHPQTLCVHPYEKPISRSSLSWRILRYMMLFDMSTSSAKCGASCNT